MSTEEGREERVDLRFEELCQMIMFKSFDFSFIFSFHWFKIFPFFRLFVAEFSKTNMSDLKSLYSPCPKNTSQPCFGHPH